MVPISTLEVDHTVVVEFAELDSCSITEVVSVAKVAMVIVVTAMPREIDPCGDFGLQQ